MRPTPYVIAVGAVIVLLGVLTVRESAQGGVVTSDTYALLDGTAALDRCLEAGKLRCDETIDRWPPLQYVPALALKRLGLSYADTASGLVYLNGLAVLGVLALLWLAGRRARAPGLASFALLAGLVSPLLWYAAAGFGEGLAAFFTVLIVAGVVLRWSPVVVGGAMFAAMLSKETALPFLLALGFLALLLPARDDPRRRSLAVALGTGALAGAVAIALFNLMRYGVPWNRYYVRDGWAVQGAFRRLDYFAAQLVAPNSGILWFWPFATAAIAAAAAGAARSARSARSLRGRPGVVLGALLLLAALVATFASWWSPFGWYAWGARLIVPWVPAIFCLVLFAWGKESSALLGRILRPAPGAVAVLAVAGILGLAQLGAFLQPARALQVFLGPGFCPALPADLLERIPAADPAAHHAHAACTSRLAWRHSPLLEESARGAGGGRLPIAAIYLLALGALVVAARSEVRTRAPAGAPA